MSAGEVYHKINTVFKRDERGRIITGEFARDEFGYLADSPWSWTEKVDGMNTRVHYEPPSTPDFEFGTVTIGGRTDNAQIPAPLVEVLEPLKNPIRFVEAFGFDDSPITLYGEGYGGKIQNGGLYSRETRFVLFGVKVGRWWLERSDMRDVANKMGLDVVPVVGFWTLSEAIAVVDECARGRRSPRSAWSGVEMIEGIVGTPTVQLFDRRGERIVAKLKVKDFTRLHQ